MKILLVLIFLSVSIFAKKDFYYGFINSSGNQISEENLQAIEDGFEIIKHARQLSKEGKVEEAYSQINSFKAQNKIKVLESDLIILNAELSIKKGLKRLVIQAAKELENAINASKIHENDLARAYMVMVELKLKINKAKDAKYFANVITNNFDNPIIKAYGQIYLAKVYRHQLEYDKAIKVLYEVLTKTTDLLIATIVADELFDVYILDDKKDKAYELISKVLKRNMDYYADDSFLAIEKVNRLIKVGMPEFAVQILKELLKKTNKPSSIEDFKFKLANTYMLMPKNADENLEKAKELYKDVIRDFPEGIHSKKAKMYLDEILMRQGVIRPAALSDKYQNSESMQQKILLQELLNDKAKKKYELILRSKRIYKKISDLIAKRFGYESMNAIFDEVNIDMIKKYLKDDKCFLLQKALKSSRPETLETLIQDKKLKHNFFECLVEVPYEKVYEQLKQTFNKSRDANIYLYLERMALGLQKYNEAEDFSAKVEMVDNKDILSKEFLYRFLVLTQKNDIVSLEKFFAYAKRNENYIEKNQDNPLIIDFYYSYYLYLLKKDLKNDAKNILEKLYEKQNEFKAHIYSPFVEEELSKIYQEQNDSKKALEVLLNSLEYSRKIKPNDLAKLYYEIIKLYGQFNNTIKRDEYINKCKAIENTKDSLYKKMCDEM